jgi:hypothetical protein
MILQILGIILMIILISLPEIQNMSLCLFGNMCLICKKIGILLLKRHQQYLFNYELLAIQLGIFTKLKEKVKHYG